MTAEYVGPSALVLMAGAPGAGKSTWASARFPETSVVSLDRLRGQLTDNPGDQSATAAAVDIMFRIVKYRLARRFTTVVDATNIVYEHRHRLWCVARAVGLKTVAVVIDQPVERCIARQTYRPHPLRVPEDRIKEMHYAIQRELCGGWLQPSEITRTVTPERDDVLGHVPPNMAGAPWLA